ncbi:MAG TPA: AmmeMemoRadiSam system protein A [Gammaproteobacteria bacterium]|nr:AmmeMemoRadiSam system protein A [Gammaproteobacteria bacterium]
MSFIKLSKQHKQELLDIAEQTLYYALESGRYITLTHRDFSVPLRIRGASFVTLYSQSQLRGCIGSLHPARPLLEDVAHNAYAAGFRDPRFDPITAAEFHDIQIEISILSPLQPISFASERELLEQIQPNTDGLLIQHGARKATFLPQVWESFPLKQDFLAQLKTKAGLNGADCESMSCYRYTVDSFSTGAEF